MQGRYRACNEYFLEKVMELRFPVRYFMNGKEVKLNTVQEAIDNKLAYVTEGQKRKMV